MNPVSLRLFFTQKSNATDVRELSARQMGMSFATTWASGPSIFLGVFFLWRYGVVPGAAWMIGNVLTLSLAGAFMSYVPLARRWVYPTLWTLPLFLMYPIMDGLILLINLGAIKAALDGQGLIERISILSLLPSPVATFVAVGIGVAVVAFIQRYGFRGSVFTDLWQYSIQITAAFLFMLLTLYFAWNSSEEAVRPEWFVAGGPDKLGGRDWIMLGFAGIVTAAFSYAQMWERLSAVPARDAVRVGLWGSLYFGAYMALVGIAGYFIVPSMLLSVLALIIILTIATSTIDSSVSGFQFIARKFGVAPWWGSLTALVVILSFLFVQQAGLDAVWGFMASIRWPLVVVMVSLTLLLQSWYWLQGRSVSARS